jgi:release factor-specific protein-(glutamine-N5) methyltransferase
MRGTKGVATAVRKEDGEIVIRYEDTSPFSKRFPKLNKPFIRGIFVLIDSLKIGISSLNYSASFFEDDEEESKFEKWLNNKFGGKANDIIIAFTMILSFLLSIGLFVGIPTGVASLFQNMGVNSIGLNLIEAFLRITILIGYMWAISKFKDIYRLFQYHGAEHKTIFCYEAEEELTVENIKKYSRFHPRCGTNFMFLIMFVSVLVFTFTGWGSFIERLLIRIVLIPVISGVTYEIIKWLGKNNSRLAKMISYPGLKLQELTTKEPEPDQIEVAIASLKAAEGIGDVNISKLLDRGTVELTGIDTARLDSQLLLGKVLQKSKLHIITNFEEIVPKEKIEEYLQLIHKRKNRMPVKYILGECDFMGLDFNVEEGVLIPRSDTEVLVEEVLKLIKEDDELQVCDLCCGSGAIGIALAHYRENIHVDSVDYYEIPEKVTKDNISKNNLSGRVTFIKSDLLKDIIITGKQYNIIVSNPPYIKSKEIETLMSDVKDYEPALALDGGKDGLKFYRRIVEESKNTLIEGGILAFEIGYDQGKDVKTLMELNGFEEIVVHQDLAGLDRVVLGKFTC